MSAMGLVGLYIQALDAVGEERYAAGEVMRGVTGRNRSRTRPLSAPELY